jgi:hypothetical protein
MPDQEVEPAPQQPEPGSDDLRKANLAQALTRAIRGGWRVESQTDYNVTLVMGKKPNHILHLLLTLITAGLWLIVWIILGITKREHRRLLVVDEYGTVSG